MSSTVNRGVGDRSDPVLMMLNVIDAAMDSLSVDDQVRVARAFMSKYAPEIAHPDAPKLTPVQWRVLRTLADGLSTLEMQRHLMLSRRSVSHHVGRIIEKLDATNRYHAVAKAYQKGML